MQRAEVTRVWGAALRQAVESEWRVREGPSAHWLAGAEGIQLPALSGVRHAGTVSPWNPALGALRQRECALPGDTLGERAVGFCPPTLPLALREGSFPRR